MLSITTGSVLLLSILGACLCAKNPCPKHVEFKKIKGNRVVRIKVNNDYSGEYVMLVKTSLPYADSRGAVLKYEKDINDFQKGAVPELVYRLEFKESPRVYPRIRNIIFNGVNICKADPLPDDVTTTENSKTIKAPNQIQFANKKRTSRQISNFITKRENRCGVVDNGAVGFPWMGALFAYRVEFKNYEYVCTVTLISKEHAITAASCVQNQNTLNFDPDDLIVIFGKPKLDNWVQNSVIAYVNKVTVHPSLEHDKAGPDLAIFTLSAQLYFSERVHPICLENRNATAVVDSGTVSGWRKTRQNQVKSTTPFKVNLESVDREECKEIHPALADYSFCAGEKDSEGPCGRNVGVAYSIENEDKAHYLHGISTVLSTQRGNSCENYTIFTDVSREFKWIDSVIN